MKNKKIMIGIITIIIIIIVTILALTYILRQKNKNDIQIKAVWDEYNLWSMYKNT